MSIIPSSPMWHYFTWIYTCFLTSKTYKAMASNPPRKSWFPSMMIHCHSPPPIFQSHTVSSLTTSDVFTHPLRAFLENSLTTSRLDFSNVISDCLGRSKVSLKHWLWAQGWWERYVVVIGSCRPVTKPKSRKIWSSRERMRQHGRGWVKRGWVMYTQCQCGQLQPSKDLV